MIILHKLKWDNMFSYGENNTLLLSEDPIVQLVGLNGHGKSSIPVILEETLFNKNSRSIKKSDIINRFINVAKYSSYLSFYIDEDYYELSISRSGATQKVKLSKNNVDISSHTATDTFKQVENLFGMDFKTFSQIVYQNSGSSLQFLTATDTNRKKFLIDLLSLERYVELFETIKAIHKNVSSDLLSAQAKYDTVSDWLDKNKGESLEYLELEPIPLMDDSLILSLDRLTRELNDIDSLNTKILKNLEYKRLRNTIDIHKAITVTAPNVSELDSLTEKLGAIKSRIKEIQARIEKYSTTEGQSECRTCGQAIDTVAVEKILRDSKNILEYYKVEETTIQQTINSIKSEQTIYSHHQKLIKDFENYSRLIDASLPDLTQNKSELKAKVDDISDRIKLLKGCILTAQSTNRAKIEHNAKIDSILDQLAKMEAELEKLAKSVKIINDELGLLEILKKAFSTNGLIAYKIENSVKVLEDTTNQYLTELSDGRFQISFMLLNDKLNTVIIDNGKEIDIVALSSGELSRVTTATLLAIRRLMSTLSKNRLNILFLDETVDTLDSYGKERLVEILLREDCLNTFLMSHGYTHPLIKKLSIVKENNVSRIEEDN